MPSALSVVRTRVLPDSINVTEAIRRAVWSARDLKLLPESTLNRIFGRTIESMKSEDFEDLSMAMTRLSKFLSSEARSRKSTS
jgi:hypothetical protein